MIGRSKVNERLHGLTQKNGMLLDVSVSSKNKDKKRNKKRYNKHLILIWLSHLLILSLQIR